MADDRQGIAHGIQHQLTLHLERASELSERAKRANDAVQHEIDRALEIASEMRDASSKSAADDTEKLRRVPRRR
jgi:hypothetical protein